jgi:hypothetical protein
VDHARRCTYEPCSDVNVVFGERAHLREDYQINGETSKIGLEWPRLGPTTHIPGVLVMRDNLFVVCPGNYRAGSKTRNAGNVCESRANGEHDGRWVETVRASGEAGRMISLSFRSRRIT